MKQANEKKSNTFISSSIIRGCKFVHLFITIVLFGTCLHFYNSVYNQHGVGHTRFMIFVVLYTLVLGFSLRTYKAYDFGLTGSGMLTYSQVLADLVSGGVFYVVFVIANSKLFTPLPLLVLILAQLVVNCVWSIIVNRLYYRLNAPKKTVVFYSDETQLARMKEAYGRQKNFDVIKQVQLKDGGINWLDCIDGCEAVFLTDLPLEIRNDILEFCIENHIQCYAAPYIGDIIMMGATHMDMFSVPVFAVSRATPKIEYAIIKRATDVICSLAGIIVLSPIMAVTALAVRLYDKGPALYKQVRLTKDGREFKILKFRSMRVNAESDGVARLATDNDDRITPIGKIIRACRLDELPQLFNILKGDMSIVGPRPERPEIAAQYEKELPSFSLRLQVRAGLTGLAQVYGRYNTEPYDKLQMDLMYVNRMSLVQDFKLIMATIKILFIKESTHGTAEGQLTAMAKKSEPQPTENDFAVK